MTETQNWVAKSKSKLLSRDEGTHISLKFLWLERTVLSPRLCIARFLFDIGLHASKVPFCSLGYCGEKFLLSISTLTQGKFKDRRIRNTNVKVFSPLSQKSEELSSPDSGLVTEVIGPRVRSLTSSVLLFPGPWLTTIIWGKNSVFPKDIPKRGFL